MEIYSGFGCWFVCFFLLEKRVAGLLEYTPPVILLGQAPESHLKLESVVLAISCHGSARALFLLPFVSKTPPWPIGPVSVVDVRPSDLITLVGAMKCHVAHMYWKFSQIFVKTLSPVVGKFTQDVCDGQVLDFWLCCSSATWVRAPQTTQLEAAYREISSRLQD